MTLEELLPGQQANIINVGGEGALRRRLLDMGLTPGTSLEMGKPAPSGDPLCIRIRSYVLSLRKADAAFVEIDSVTAAASPCGNCYGCSRNPRQEQGCKSRRGRRARRRGAL
jgi:ferrous iron transport protein A